MKSVGAFGGLSNPTSLRQGLWAPLQGSGSLGDGLPRAALGDSLCPGLKGLRAFSPRRDACHQCSTLERTRKPAGARAGIIAPRYPDLAHVVEGTGPLCKSGRCMLEG